ncbi:apolipoprotein C-I [Vanacampus margaritifer]
MMMKLYLAVAVLLLALIAYADAQDETIEEKFNKYGEQVAQVFRNIADSTKETFDNIGNSQFANNVKNWFKDQFGSQ